MKILLFIFISLTSVLYSKECIDTNYIKTDNLYYTYNKKKGIVSLYTDTNDISFITNIKIKNKNKKIEYIKVFNKTNNMILGRINGDYELYDLSKSKKISTLVSSVDFGFLLNTGELGFGVAFNARKPEKKESKVYISKSEKYFFIHNDSGIITCYTIEDGKNMYSRSLNFYAKLEKEEYINDKDILYFKDGSDTITIDVISGSMDYLY